MPETASEAKSLPTACITLDIFNMETACAEDRVERYHLLVKSNWVQSPFSHKVFQHLEWHANPSAHSARYPRFEENEIESLAGYLYLALYNEILQSKKPIAGQGLREKLKESSSPIDLGDYYFVSERNPRQGELKA